MLERRTVNPLRTTRRDFFRGVAGITTASAIGIQAQPGNAADWNSDYSYYQPLTLKQALLVRASLGNKIVPVSGGTIVGRDSRFGNYRSHSVLDLSQIRKLRNLRASRDRLTIGTLVPFAALQLVTGYCCLSKSAAGVGGPTIRQMATLGGNLAAARSDADGCVAALALGGHVQLRRGRRETRTVSIDEFFGAEEGRTSIQDDELLTQITVMKPAHSGWFEVGTRLGASHSIVCCALARNSAGKIRIAVGGAAPTVIRLSLAEESINRDGVNSSTIRDAADIASNEVNPPNDNRGSEEYRRHLVGVAVQRLLEQLRTSK